MALLSRCLLVIALSLLVASPALAWNGPGHTAIGLLAWDQMSPESRERAAEILCALPTYDRDLTRGAPSGDEARTRWAFGRAAAWPTMIRSEAHPMHDGDRPGWRDIDTPIEIGARASAPSLSGYPPRNVVEAIEHNLAKLQSPATSDADRAVALCWLAQLVGEIHQPLHAATLYSPVFPMGDDGGRRFLVTRPGRGVTDLHTLWDELLADDAAMRRVDRVARRLGDQVSPQAVAVAARATAPSAWARESHELAQSVTYAEGRLRGVNAQTRAKAQAAPVLPGGYEARARQVARERSAIAAHRLAALLDRALAGR